MESFSTTSLVRSEKASGEILIGEETLFLSAVVSISLVGEEFVDVAESNLLLTIQLELTGFSYGVIPLQIIPVSYSQFEDARERLGIKLTLMEIAGSQQVPSQSSVPCE